MKKMEEKIDQMNSVIKRSSELINCSRGENNKLSEKRLNEGTKKTTQNIITNRRKYSDMDEN